MYEFKTFGLCEEGDLAKLNQFYQDGWEFVHATAPITATTNGYDAVILTYFTIRRLKSNES